MHHQQLDCDHQLGIDRQHRAHKDHRMVMTIDQGRTEEMEIIPNPIGDQRQQNVDDLHLRPRHLQRAHHSHCCHIENTIVGAPNHDLNQRHHRLRHRRRLQHPRLALIFKKKKYMTKFKLFFFFD